MRLQPHTKNYRQLRKSGSRRHDLPPEKHTNCLLSAKKVSPEDLYTSNLIMAEQVIFRNIYDYMHMY